MSSCLLPPFLALTVFPSFFKLFQARINPVEMPQLSQPHSNVQGNCPLCFEPRRHFSYPGRPSFFFTSFFSTFHNFFLYPGGGFGVFFQFEVPLFQSLVPPFHIFRLFFFRSCDLPALCVFLIFYFRLRDVPGPRTTGFCWPNNRSLFLIGTFRFASVNKFCLFISQVFPFSFFFEGGPSPY